MPGVSLEEYRELIVRSGLLPPDAVQEQLSSYASIDDTSVSESDDDAATSFARYLERNGLLTSWQNANLLRGRFRGLVFGKFRILRLLGAGGMGRVFLAENQLLKRHVALKVLPRKLSCHPTALERFHREARALARLNHNNIVRVHDVDVHEQTHFIVMEFVKGVDLQRKVASDGPLDEAHAADLIRQAADGLAHAHNAGLIHRDIKPANMLLSASGVIKVLDLGLALLQTDQDGAITADPSRALGTADYISPEQALNSRQIDARTDIYSLGCSLYFLLTGTAPFGNGTDAQRLLAHQLKEPEPINAVRGKQGLPPVSTRMLSLCQRMMAKDPAGRPASASLVAIELATIPGDCTADQAIPLHGAVSDSQDSPWSVDAESWRQLKTISESASVTSVQGSSGGTAVPRPRRVQSPSKFFWILSGATAVVLLIGGTVAWSITSPEPVSQENIKARSEPAVTPPRATALVVIGDNRTYHQADCHHVRGRTNLRTVTTDMLDTGFLKPCRTCRPDQ